MRTKALDARIAALFKPWFVRRTRGGCQVLLPITELDPLIASIIKETKRCPDPRS